MKVKLAWTINNLWPSHHSYLQYGHVLIQVVIHLPYSSISIQQSQIFSILKQPMTHQLVLQDKKSNWSSQIGYVSFNLFTSPMIYVKNISKFMLFNADYRFHSLFTHMNFLPLCKFFKLYQLFFSHLKPQCQFFRFFFGNIYLSHISL